MHKTSACVNLTHRNRLCSLLVRRKFGFMTCLVFRLHDWSYVPRRSLIFISHGWVLLDHLHASTVLMESLPRLEIYVWKENVKKVSQNQECPVIWQCRPCKLVAVPFSACMRHMSQLWSKKKRTSKLNTFQIPCIYNKNDSLTRAVPIKLVRSCDKCWAFPVITFTAYVMACVKGKGVIGSSPWDLTFFVSIGGGGQITCTNARLNCSFVLSWLMSQICSQNLALQS